MNPIRKRRKELDVSAVELATLCDVSSALVGFWESGRSMPTSAQINDLADILKMDARVLHTGLRAFRAGIAKQARRKIAAVTS